MIILRHEIPAVADFLRLRQISGLSPRSAEAAAQGLPNSLYAVTLYDGDKAVGMGRVIGDGGLNFEVVDIAVDPAYQGQGLGRQIMEAIMAWLDIHVPQGGYICLIADVPPFYEKFGFEYCSPGVGMQRNKR